MALRTNKLDVLMDCGAFDERFDIFAVAKEGDDKLSWSSRVFEPFGTPYILSILGQGGDKPFYILSPKGAVTVSQLRSHFEDGYGGEIADENLEPTDVGRRLLPRNVPSASVPRRILVQLLLNALCVEGGKGSASLQNVTGHLYCFKTGRDWVKKTKDKRPYQIIGLEFRVTEEMLLRVNVRTFTRANASGLKFDTKKKNEYPRYVVDFTGPTMRRVAPGEKPQVNDVYINKQYERDKNRIPFLKFKSLKAFRDSKCGVIQELIERFNATYAGIASLSFVTMDDSMRVPVPEKLLKADYHAWFSRSEYAVVDVAKDDASGIACSCVADWLAYDENLGKRPDIVGSAIMGANNLLVIHERNYYQDRGIDDPYRSSMIPGVACQHLTVETIQSELGKDKNQSNLRFVIPKCLVEAAVKQDVCDGAMGLYDWSALGLESSLAFALDESKREEGGESEEHEQAPRRYSFLEVAPDGALAFHRGCIDDAESGSRWDQLAYDLAGERSFRTEGFIIDADDRIDVIERTDEFPVPDLDAVKRAVESIDWSLPKDEMLAVLSIATGDPILDEALGAMCEQVSGLGGNRVTSAKVNALVTEAAKLCPGSYSARRVRSLLDERMEDMFSMRLQTCVRRDREALQSVYEPIVWMHCIKDDDGLLYWVNASKGLNQTGRDVGCVIRHVRNVDGDEPFSTNLIETLAVPIARLGSASVLPLPFKYLREWMDVNGIRRGSR